jgi:hypothetical protein
VNLFALDVDPIDAARAHCDGHLSRMALQACRLMAGAHELVDHLTGLRDYDKPHRLAPRHRDLACARWVRETRGNYLWAHTLAIELTIEHHRRFGRPASAAQWLECYAEPPVGLTLDELTQFGQSISPHAPGPCPVIAYRMYYACRKWHFAKWRRGRAPPHWWRQALEEVGKREIWEARAAWPK